MEEGEWELNHRRYLLWLETIPAQWRGGRCIYMYIYICTSSLVERILVVAVRQESGPRLGSAAALLCNSVGVCGSGGLRDPLSCSP